MAKTPSMRAGNIHPAGERQNHEPALNHDQLSIEQAAAERALRDSQRLISIGRLSAEIAHEINNPLESVGNLLYLALQEAGMPDSAQAYLHSAERELQRVAQISRQTLSFSRETNEPVSINPIGLMDEVVSMYSRRIAQKQLRLTQDYASTGKVKAIPGEIRQVFSNLVTNAIEASTTGGKLSLRIRDTHHHSTGSGISIVVCDHGTGIEPAARKRLGEMFFTTKGESGTGLGLWVTNAIVARYGGTMQLRSSTGRNHGTTFRVFLPVGDPAHRKHKSGSRRPGNITEISRHPRHAANTHFNEIASEIASGTIDEPRPLQRKV